MERERPMSMPLRLESLAHIVENLVTVDVAVIVGDRDGSG